MDSTERLERACLLISNSTELAPFIEWLDAQSAANVQALIACPDDRQTAVLQGQARTFRQIKKLLDDAKQRRRQQPSR